MEDIVSLPILLLKGIIIGIVVSAPMGPVGILCIRRTIKKGTAYGLATGIGAALSDLIYALITGYGLSRIPFLQDEDNAFWIKIIGSAMLLGFGLYMYRSGPKIKEHPEGKTKGSLLRNGITAFFITLFNPAIIFLFIALFNITAFFAGGHSQVVLATGYAGIAAGALLWWLGLTYIIGRMRKSFGEKGIRRLNRTVGVIVIVFSVVYATLTICGIPLIPTDSGLEGAC